MRVLLALILLTVAAAAHATPVTAVVATRVIHPGEEIGVADLRIVVVRNRRPVHYAVARRLEQATGLVAKRTLLPRRYIPLAALRPVWLVETGKPVKLRWHRSGISLQLVATALQPGAEGDLINVRNPASGKVLKAVVMARGLASVLAR